MNWRGGIVAAPPGDNAPGKVRPFAAQSFAKVVGFSLLCREDEPPLLTDVVQLLADPDLREAPAAFGAEPPQHDHQPIAIEYFSKLTVITDGCPDQFLAKREELLRCDPCLRVRLAL